MILRRVFRWILIGAFCLSSWGASEHQGSGNNVYYVDSQNGDDHNDGRSPEKAWQSLEQVNSIEFQPGDRVLFASDTDYLGQLKPRGTGTEGRPIVIDTYGQGGRPRIHGQGKVLQTVYLYNTEYWEIRNLEITNTGEERLANRLGVFVHLEDFGTAHHIHLQGLYVHDVNGSVVKQEGGGGGIKWDNEGSLRKSRFDGLLIENCHIQRCERDGIRGIAGYSSRDNWYPSLNVVIRGNLIEEVPGDGIVPKSSDGPLVEYNVMRNCTRLLPEGDAAAGIWPHSCDNAVIQFNEVSDHKAPWDAQGFDSDYNCRNTLIQYNYSHDNEGGFLLICDNGAAKLPSNIGNIGLVVRYNISVNDGIRPHLSPRGGYHSPIFHIAGPVKDIQIYNNTVYVPAKTDPRVDRSMIRMHNWGGPWPKNILFSNNIFYVEGQTQYVWGEAENCRFDHNVFYGQHTDVPDDPYAITADPIFVSPDSAVAGLNMLRGLMLREGSPAIGAGMIVSDNGGRDFRGNPVPTDRPVDIGAFQSDFDK